MIKITSDTNNIRLDQYLTQTLKDQSRSFIQKMIKEGYILVNDSKVKTGFILKEDDEITINLIEEKPLDLTPVNLNLDIIYEDDDIVVINKPKGLVVHPASTVSTPTLVHGLLYQINNLSTINGIFRPGIVHRLDKDTSGLMVVAKNDNAHRVLSEALSKREVKRNYYAICYGNFKHTRGTIDAAIARDPNNRLQMSVNQDGKYAKTHFEVLKQTADYALVRCELETGRTHQIRVHMKFINHPILGDKVYGPSKVFGDEGQYLCAYFLSFVHPKTKKEMVFEIPLPNSFKEILD